MEKCFKQRRQQIPKREVGVAEAWSERRDDRKWVCRGREASWDVGGLGEELAIGGSTREAGVGIEVTGRFPDTARRLLGVALNRHD